MATQRTDRVPLGSLELLVEMDSHGSISAAARALGLTQPSASAGLRRLERSLGLDLIVRTTSGARLTETGRATAAWAREVLAASDRFETGVAALRAAPKVRVKIAASLTIAEYLAPRWLATLAGDTNGPEVELVVRNSRRVMELVLADEVELGFIESSSVRRGLRSRVVAEDELVAVVAPGHPWAQRRSVTATELLSGGLVVREEGSGTRQTLERALDTVGKRLPERLASLGSTAAMATAVRHGGSVAVLSSLTVADELSRGAFVRVNIPELDLARRLRIVWKDGAEMSSASRRIAAVAAL